MRGMIGFEKVARLFGRKKKGTEAQAISGWLNIYPEGFTGCFLFDTEEKADQDAHEQRLGDAVFVEHKY